MDQPTQELHLCTLRAPTSAVQVGRSPRPLLLWQAERAFDREAQRDAWSCSVAAFCTTSGPTSASTGRSLAGCRRPANVVRVGDCCLPLRRGRLAAANFETERFAHERQNGLSVLHGRGVQAVTPASGSFSGGVRLCSSGDRRSLFGRGAALFAVSRSPAAPTASVTGGGSWRSGCRAASSGLADKWPGVVRTGVRRATGVGWAGAA